MSNPDEAKKEEEATSAQQPASVEEENAANEESSEDGTQEQPTAQEIATWKKKAEDFDRSVELKRLSKLSSGSEVVEPSEDSKGDGVKNSEGLSAEDIKKMVAEGIKIGVRSANKPIYEENLRKAYRKFIGENKWADSDEIIANISKNFNADDALTESQLYAQFNAAAEVNYPEKYKKAQEDRIRAQVLSEKANIDAGNISGSGSGNEPSSSKDPSRKLSPQEQKFLNAMGVNK